jgi:hypothetical protein
MHSENNNLLRRVCNHLLLNASSSKDLSLFYGKMGISIFFYHYAKYLQEPIYSEYADVLIDEICEEVHDSIPFYMENGLCGIGWGIEYLKKENFINGDTNELLFDIDRIVLTLDIDRFTNYSFDKGLEGILYYVLSRLLSDNKSTHPFDQQYLTKLQNMVIRCCSTFKYPIIASSFLQFYNNNRVKNFNLFLPECLYPTFIVEKNISVNMPLGLKKGLAGIGMKLLFT